MQTEQFKCMKVNCNAHDGRHIKKHCPIEDDSHALLEKAIDKFRLSTRAFNRILKIARTIADLTGSEDIKVIHISEMIQYRSLDRKNLFRGELCCVLRMFDCLKPTFDKNLSGFCQKLFQNLLRLLFIFSPLLWIIPKSEKKERACILANTAVGPDKSPDIQPHLTLCFIVGTSIAKSPKNIYAHLL